MNNLKPTIGIEVHVELKTNSKAFSPSINHYNSPSNRKQRNNQQSINCIISAKLSNQ